MKHFRFLKISLKQKLQSDCIPADWCHPAKRCFLLSHQVFPRSTAADVPYFSRFMSVVKLLSVEFYCLPQTISLFETFPWLLNAIFSSLQPGSLHEKVNSAFKFNIDFSPKSFTILEDISVFKVHQQIWYCVRWLLTCRCHESALRHMLFYKTPLAHASTEALAQSKLFSWS